METREVRFLFFARAKKSHDTMSTEAKPFLKWAGGKGQLTEQLAAYLPKRIFEEPFTYMEPFVGGGAMLYYMLRTFPNIRKVVINDINEPLITTYRIVRDDVEALITQLKELEATFYGQASEEERKAMFLDVRERYNNPTCQGILKSAYLLFLNRTCFNGLYRVNSKGLFNVPFGRYARPAICNADLLRADSHLFQQVEMEIRCGDYADVADPIDGLTFVYLDPPYRPLSETSSFTAYAKGDFNDDDQRALADFCRMLTQRGCLWMQSNADCSAKNPLDTFFEDLYADCLIERVMAARHINANPSKRGKLTELLIHNIYELR